MGTWRHLIRYCDVDELRFGHDYVNATFTHGPHHGCSVMDTVRELQINESMVLDSLLLVGLEQDGKIWIVYGNRRLTALRTYADQVRMLRPVIVRVIVHPYPCKHIRSEALRCRFLMKAATAISTENDGQHIMM